MGPSVRIAAVLLATGLAACAPAQRAEHPGIDVVVITIDTLRPDHLGFHGYPRETAPFLASLAARGAVFDRAFSTSSWTAPATASIFTGLYPTRHGVVQGFFAHRKRVEALERGGEPVIELNRLPEDRPTLAELFRRAGYATFGAGGNVNIGPTMGFDRGFDRFAYMREEQRADLVAHVGRWENELLSSPKPTFLYLHPNDVHHPYHEREPWYREQGDAIADLVAAYDSEISFLDERLAGLAERLQWGERTLVLVTSDHGEEFADHGGRWHQAGLHQELNRVLMVFAGPGIDPGRIRANVSLVDVLPTLAELVGFEPPAPRAGTSLVPLLRRETRADPAVLARFDSRVLFAHRLSRAEDRTWWSALRGSWKLIDDGEHPVLFDHAHDPTEHDDRSASEPERVRELAAALERFRTERPPTSHTTRVPLDRDLVRELRELGYVDAASPDP